MLSRRSPGGSSSSSSSSPGPTLALVALALLSVVPPSSAWYKHVASPRYHTVGRASGLLMGVRRSPYLWRRQLDGEARGGRPERGGPFWWPVLPPMAREGPPAWTPREPAAGQEGKRDPGGLPNAPHRRPAEGSSGKRSAWAELCPPRCPEETPGRRDAPGPESLERALREGRWSRRRQQQQQQEEEAAASRVELAI